MIHIANVNSCDLLDRGVADAEHRMCTQIVAFNVALKIPTALLGGMVALSGVLDGHLAGMV